MGDFRIGVVGLAGGWSTEALADAVEARTGFRRIVDLQAVSVDLSSRRLIHRGENLCGFDALIVKKITRDYSPASLDRLELLRIAEGQGVRVFSPAARTLRLIDRLSCTVSLINAGLPMPETRITEDEEVALEAVSAFGEAVFKPLYSSKACGMCVIDSDQPCERIERAVAAFHATNPVMYIQKKKRLNGRDFGLVFLGGEYLGCYARVAAGSWNTTIREGGRYRPHHAEAELIDLGYRAQALFGMDFTTVDVALTEDGPVVFEVSAFGGFRGALQGIGIDAAGLYADYVVAALKQRGDG